MTIWMMTSNAEDEFDGDVADKLQESWDEFELLQSDANLCIHNNDYLNKLFVSGGIHINHSSKVLSIMRGDDCELKLFFLFLMKSFFSSVHKWMIDKSHQSRVKCLKELSSGMFFAYFGLELGMSIISYNDIEQYWASSIFQGHPTYSNTMGHNQLQLIRSLLCFVNSNSYNHEVASKDPLWHSLPLLEHFIQNSAKIATPIGPSALDECSAKNKARTGAKTFNAKKPDKFAVRFYAVAGSVNPYISSFFDNRAGNKTGVCAAVNCCRIFHSLWTPYNNEFHSNNQIKIGKDFPSSLWLLQMAHQTQNFPDPSGRRVFFVDNFYTRHQLAHAVKVMKDGESRMIGTVRFTNIDCTNHFYVQKAIDLLDAKPHGSWCLVRAYDEHPELSLNQ